MIALVCLAMLGLTLSQDDTFFYKGRAMKIHNVGDFLPYRASSECARQGYRWLPIVDKDSNDVVQSYMKASGITSAWLGLLQSFGGSFRWLGLSESPETVGYENWDRSDPKRGYVYIDSKTGLWKTVLYAEKKSVLCVELSKACEKDGRYYADGFKGNFGCDECSCTLGFMNCKYSSKCIARATEGCEYEGKIIKVGDGIDVGCKRCTCVKTRTSFVLTCTKCEVVDETIGTVHDTRFRQRNQCPPLYSDRGFEWIDCSDKRHSGCDKSCETPDDLCGRRCVPRCACPPDAPYLSHGFCKPECPGRRFAPVIIEGPSNRVFPETGEVIQVKCSAIGEPTPEIRISESEFTPDLSKEPMHGELGLRTSTADFKAYKELMPKEVYCYAWNVNGVSKTSASFTVISKNDKVANPSIGRDGNLKMPPMIRVGIENLVLGNKYGQRMKCVVTGAPKPEVEIVKLNDGTTFPTVTRNAAVGIHDVEVETTVMIEGESDTGVYACMAANKYGAVKDEATLGFTEKAAGPGDVAMLLRASGFVKDAVVLEEWPFLPTERSCEHAGQMYEDGQTFKADCNTCRCANSLVTCTENECQSDGCTDSEGNTRKVYERWQDDCNKCVCLTGGKAHCTDNQCEKAKNYCTKPDGMKVSIGETTKVDCNRCICMKNTQLRCTKKTCKDKEEKADSGVQCTWFGGQQYKVGDTWKHGCKSCMCHESGRPICTDENCQSQCSYNGRPLPTGLTFRDNCRICRCNEDGDISCEGEPCPESKSDCNYKDKNYKLQETFKDDCNMCICLRNGLVTCTKNVCLAPKKPCIFQKVRKLNHGTQLQVECNLCTCNDGNMSCTENKCPGIRSKNKVGCKLEGEQRVYTVGSAIQLGNKLCTCSVVGHSTKGQHILDFICS